ncbi:MAG: hypothetical protein ACRCWG_04235 [Sarcina sp.]
MAYRTMQHPSGIQKQVKVGFSWTTFFFDFWPCVFRGEWSSAIKLFLLGPLTLGIYTIFKWFSINDDYYESLLMQGFMDISTTPWHGPKKENPIVKIYKTFYEANPKTYKKFGIAKLSELVNINGLIDQPTTAKIQTGLVIAGFIFFVLTFLSNFSDYGLIEDFINTIVKLILIGGPIFIIASVALLTFTIDIEMGNNMEGYGQDRYNYQDNSQYDSQGSYNYNNGGKEQSYGYVDNSPKQGNSYNHNEKYMKNNQDSSSANEVLSEADRIRLTELEKKLIECQIEKDIESIAVIEEMIAELKRK